MVTSKGNKKVQANSKIMKIKIQKLFFFLQLIRYQNLMIMIFTLFFVKYFLIPPFFTPLSSVAYSFLVISVVLIAAGGYLINDLYDVEIDNINKPAKVLIYRIFTQKTVLYFYGISNFFGVLLGFLISFPVGFIHFFCALSLWLYARYLKKTALLGNILVAFLSGLVVLMVDVLYQTHFPLVYAFAIFAFFISLIREIVKDIEDIEGDSATGCRTFPMIFGIANTKLLIYTLLLFFVFALFSFSFLSSYLFLEGNLFFKGIFFYDLCISFLLIFLAYKLSLARQKTDFHFISSFCKLIMLVGMVGIMILRFL